MKNDSNKASVKSKKNLLKNTISFSVIGWIVLNLINPLFININDYTREYNVYLERVYYDRNNDNLEERIPRIKKALNIEDREEHVFIYPGDRNQVLMVLYSDSNMHNIGFYDIDFNKYLEVDCDINKYVERYGNKDGGILTEKITPSEVFIILAPESEVGANNYLLWESPTYEMGMAALEWNDGAGKETINVNGLDYIVYGASGYRKNNKGEPISSISYKKTLKSTIYHILDNLSL
ncbi:hypothetical protein [Clostridium sp. HCS.1]|uniref:hypothetical protein n=1 Tax=Clostridium sp. HCS.1 TaxID=3238594 RepID=UPI003A100248